MMSCPKCSAMMNHHAEKVDLTPMRDGISALDRTLDGILQDVYACPNCGNIELRRASEARNR